MSDYADHLRRHRRSSILRVLSASPEYRSNESLITDVVESMVPSTRDQVRTEMLWLGEQGMATVTELGGLLVATITQRGLDIACGKAVHPDVKKPSPKG